MFARVLLGLIAVGGACAAAGAVDMPARRSGLWQITLNNGDSRIPPLVQRVCLDAATDQLLYKVAVGATQRLCSRVDVQSAGGQIMVESQCDFGGSHVTSRGVTTMSGDAAYHTDVNIHYEPALFGKSGMTATQDAKWLGTCPADMKPGDVEVTPSPMMPAPIKMNLNDMFKGGQ